MPARIFIKPVAQTVLGLLASFLVVDGVQNSQAQEKSSDGFFVGPTNQAPLLPDNFDDNSELYSGYDPAHRDCLRRVLNDVEIGRIAAQQWVQEGGGPRAYHCLAAADVAAGFPKLAAVRLQQLAETPSAGDNLTRARLYAQAAEIWLEINDTKMAHKLLGLAFNLVPQSGELFLLSGRIHAVDEQWQPVVKAITEAEEAGFVSAQGYFARAKAHQALSQLEAAADDVVNGMRIDPFNLDMLVLRGELQQRGITINTNFRRQGTPAPAKPVIDEDPVDEIPERQ